MARIEAEIRRIGGIASTAELSAAGFSVGYLRAATSSNAITRVRKGWYANPWTDVNVLRAWRVGGRLACVSAAAHHGLWVPDTWTTLHVSVPVTAARLRIPTSHKQRLAENPDVDTRIHWDGPSRYGDRVAVPIETALIQAFRCVGSDAGFVLMESALHLGALDVVGRSNVLSALSESSHRAAALATGDSESGIESLIKLLLLRLGIPFRQQAVFDEIGRVDFLVGDRLVIEVDGRAFHSDAYKDRRRDALLSIAGRRVLRFLYAQIVYEAPIVEAAVVAALARSDHNRA